jgi:hypothetical protein
MADRNYKKERANYHSKPEQMAKNAARKRARRALEKEGKVKPFDGKDVIHKSGNPMNNKRSNLGVQSKSENRSFARTKSARKKNKTD